MQKNIARRFEFVENKIALNVVSPSSPLPEKVGLCPVCNHEMTPIQTCHIRCNQCGAELSCEDKGWFW